MNENFGKVCPHHSELNGKRTSSRNCVGCDNERKRAMRAAPENKPMLAAKRRAAYEREKRNKLAAMLLRAYQELTKE